MREIADTQKDLILSQMTDLLKKQLEIHSQLLEISYEKRQAIISGNTDRLSEIVQLEIEGLSAISKQEEKRAQLIEELSGQLGVPKQDITIHLLIENCNKESKENLQDLQKQLKATLEKQAELNQVNQQLLQTQLEYGQTLLNVMVTPEDPLNNFYGTDGNEQDEKRESAGFFDEQI